MAKTSKPLVIDYGQCSSNFRALVICQNDRDKHPDSDKHYVKSSPDNSHFLRRQKEKSIRSFRTFAILFQPSSKN